MPSWFAIAFLAPFLWALVSVLDTYFVHDVYEDEYDITLVSGVFQSLPWLLVPLGIIHVAVPAEPALVYAIAAGGLFLFSFLWYFRALFMANDSTLMQILWSVSVLIVPFFSWIYIGEVLAWEHYTGILIAFLGISLFLYDGKVRFIGYGRIFIPMGFSVLALSLSMTIGKMAYLEPETDFWSIFLFFSLGATTASLLLFLVSQSKRSILSRAKKIFLLSKNYLVLFLLAESLSVIASLTSLKAISLAPSVSLVAVIESLVPVFVMVISLLVIAVFRWQGKERMVAVYQEQMAGMKIKIMAICLVAVGIYVAV